MARNKPDPPVKKVVSDNVKRLMAHHADLKTIEKLSAASHVPTGTVDRIKRGITNCRIDNLEALAAAFELRAWHLLIPDLDPTNPPVYLRKREQELYARMAETAQELHSGGTRPGSGSLLPVRKP